MAARMAMPASIPKREMGILLAQVIKNKPDSLELFKDSAQVSTREFFEKFEVVGGAEEDREVSNNV